MKKKSSTYNTHLTLNDRLAIQSGIENNITKTAIAKLIGKDNSTVGKEIKLHRILKPSRRFSILSNDAFKESCARRDRSPGACNGCDFFSVCKNARYLYDAQKAHNQYQTSLSSSREGIMLTPDQVRSIGKIIAPLIKQGQSISQIYMTHRSKLLVNEKTMYNYIEQGVFRDYDIINLSLKEKVNRKPRKTKHKVRKSPANYTGHTYSDYLELMAQSEFASTIEMDTLYNAPQGPFIQTLILTDCKVMIGFLHESRTSENMSSSLNVLQERLGTERFKRIMNPILADRGSEFVKHKLFEFDANGNRRTLIYYCDPMCPHQKPHVENNHNYVRDILPNGYDLSKITQDDVNEMFLHINNTPRKSKGNRTPIELMQFLYPDDFEIMLEAFNLSVLDRDQVVLNPTIFD